MHWSFIELLETKESRNLVENRGLCLYCGYCRFSLRWSWSLLEMENSMCVSRQREYLGISKWKLLLRELFDQRLKLISLQDMSPIYLIGYELCKWILLVLWARWIVQNSLWHLDTISDTSKCLHDELDVMDLILMVDS